MTHPATSVGRSIGRYARPRTVAAEPAHSEARSNHVALVAVAGTSYAALVAILWAPFGTRSGMGYETTLVYLSESRSFFDGFFYDWDPLRRYMQLFYHAGYQLSNVLGIDGSFLGNQLVYAALWWARGLLVFLIVRRLFPSLPLLAYAAGALVIVHAGDHALNWVGQLNQFGMMFWALLAIYLLVVALQETRARRALGFAVAAAGAAYMCLWSYESPLFMLILVPLLLAPLVGLSRRTGAVVGVFYVVPLLFVARNLERYVGDDGATYQEGVARESFAPAALVGDLAFNVERSIRFWAWDDPLPDAASSAGPALAGLAAAVVFASGAVLLAHIAPRPDERVSRRSLALLFCSGALVLVASFPAYLALSDARSLWRTQLLSGIGFGVAAAAVLVLGASAIRSQRVRTVSVATAGAAIAYAGGHTAYLTGNTHYDVWERHRTAIAQVLEVAPRVAPGTVVVLTDLPAAADPFGHNMWFDVALRLAYPHTPVAGQYYKAGGEPAPGANLVVRGDEWRQEPTGFPTLLGSAPFSKTVIVRYSPSGRPELLRHVPRFVTKGERALASYDPRGAVLPGEASPLAQRRYGAP